MPDSRPVLSYTIQDVRLWLTPAIMQRGAAYVARVSQLHVSAERISGWVQGSAPRPYWVEVHFGATLRPSLSCSCPVGFACKHVAAVLLRALMGAERDQAPAINPAVLQWIEDLRRSQGRGEKKSVVRRERLFYLLDPDMRDRRGAVVFLKGRTDANGAPAAGVQRWENVERALLQPPAFVDEADIIALRQVWMQRPKGYGWGPILLSGKGLDAIMRAMLATGRVYTGTPDGDLHPLQEGPPRAAEVFWQARDETWTVLQLRLLTGQGTIMGGEQPWYVDAEAGLVGPIECDVPQDLLGRLFDLPALTVQDRQVLGSVLDEVAPALPSPVAAAGVRVIDCAPRPLLQLRTVLPWSIRRHKQYDYGYERPYDLAIPVFAYEGHQFYPDDHHEFIALDSGETVKVCRRFADEAHLLASLTAVGLTPVDREVLSMSRGELPHSPVGLDSEAAWPAFMTEGVRRLRAAGWTVDIPPDFRHHRLEVTAWDAELREAGQGWFDLDLGIEVEQRRVALAPVLAALFKREPRWLSPDIVNTISDDEGVDLPLPDGSLARVRAERVKPLARTLIDLFDGAGDGSLRVSGFDAARLQVLDDPARWRFRGPASLQAMVDRLRAAGAVQPVEAPVGFGLPLRGYQLEGLAWLQYLRAQDLAGILADDMGLGKTAQTLAHLLLEKQAGRLTQPALVVLPTSLVFNWKREAAQAAPSLRVLALHGKDRAAHFGAIANHDVVLTTYPLVWRDQRVLGEQEWHMLILDEAQSVKNAAGRAAQALRELRARHRLCLTGTPLENHLGELWAQFDFLLPGFLGDSKNFSRRWRNPIEKQGDAARRDILAQRVRPFILRRRKEDVAKELPDKTVVVRRVELTGGQRDLYEAVRATVDENVQKLIAAQGFRRSQIVILDALLKLRQVCCDPRLVSLPSAAAVRECAKLDLLADMLPELMAEGRRVLLFSQFTGMLDLIEELLQRLKLPWVRLDGQTQDRERVVAQFQNGEVPLFLLSLKAGGVGLNLTAADTVIHYDPWWNPAAEQQATDRAHRIGQERAVFVYKLVVAGSIEERIVALQERKAELADGILQQDGGQLARFDSDDLLALLQPLE